VLRRAFADWIWMRPALIFTGLFLGYTLWAGFSKDLWFDGGQDLLVALVLALAILAVVPVFLGWFGSPTPRIETHASLPEPIRIQGLAVHHLAVWNHELPKWVRPLVLRVAPEGCQLRVRYTNVETLQIMLRGEWVLARWNDNQEPLREDGQLSIPAMISNRRLRSKLFPSEKAPHRNAYPFTVAFAIKREGDEWFYHFSDESYRWAGETLLWLNPTWRMPQGIYRVDVELTGYGLIHPSVASFRLSNGGTTHESFVLEPWSD